MNKKILTPLFVAASFLLVGCSTDTIVARPSWIDDPIIDIEGLKDNKMKEIYDAIKELGDTNANVLNKVMYDIAQKQLGTFKELRDLSQDEATDDQIKAFVSVKEHSMYQADEYTSKLNASGEVETIKVEDIADETEREATKIAISRNKIKQQFSAIVERVCELMYNEVKDGSYFTDGVKKLYSEEEYVRHLKKELYWPDTQGVTLKKDLVFIPKSIDDTDDNTWEKHANKYLNLTDGKGNFTKVYYPTDSDVDPHHDGGYIGRKILPDVYRELLIQNYVREQRYTNLGRGYARKAKMIKIEGGEIPGKVQNMLFAYAKEHITGDGNGTKATPAKNGLEGLSKAMIGIADAGSSAAVQDSPRYYLEKGGFERIKLSDETTDLKLKTFVNENGGPVTTETPTVETYVYSGTKLGNIVETLKKAYTLEAGDTAWGNFKEPVLKLPFNDEVKTAYNDLTNNGAYPLEIGLELKERELFSTDLTQDGWFMKNGGLTDLSETFRNDLFNITTSNVIDDETSMTPDEKGWGTFETGDTARYFEEGGTGNMHAYLITSAVQDPWEQVVLYDGSSNFFIVEIEEAASLAKLSLEDDRAYINLRATNTYANSNKAMNEIVGNIAKQVANDDTYKKNAEQYYLMISNILFYDQSVYDYFKSQFPDLFK